MDVELYEGLKFTLPKQPVINTIQGNHLPKKQQKWYRTAVPENFDSLPFEQKETFVLEEFRRRREGHWFMNNGTATYITGHNYFYLNYCKFEFGYPEYRDVDRRAFFFWQICEDDPNCYGEVRVKFRRLGATSQGEAIALNIATLNHEVHCGLLSKTGTDASKIFGEIADLIKWLPDFFIPLMDGKDNPKKQISFRRPSKLLTNKNSKINRGIELNSKIDWKTTVENAYDGYKMRFAMIDEPGKWLEANIKTAWDIHKPCFATGKYIRGKAYLPSTVNEMVMKGGAAYKGIWDNSDPNKRDGNGRTISGLYRYFSPADDGLEGFIDEYGMSMREEAGKYLDNIEESLKHDSVQLNEHRRQFPRRIEDAFRMDNKQSPFDIIRINEQIDYNSLASDPLVRGNFVWKNAQRDLEVEWQLDPNGRWSIAWFPPTMIRNNFKIHFGKKAPANTDTGCFGVDPYDHRTTATGKRSNAASYGYLKFNPMRPTESAIFVSEYINRPSDPEDMYEDILMQCVFYGWEVLSETNKPGLINYFTKRGYEHYLMDRPEETENDYSQRRKTKEKGLATGPAIQNHIVEITQHHIYNNVGYIQEVDEKGRPKEARMGKCYFNNLLHDWAQFDPNDDWTDRDPLVGAGYALMGSRKFIPKKPERKVIELFEKFNHTGTQSVRIDGMPKPFN